MPIRFELSRIEHPFKLCLQCNERLGAIKIIFEPGARSTAETFSCEQDLGLTLHLIGDGITKLIEEEKGND